MSSAQGIDSLEERVGFRGMEPVDIVVVGKPRHLFLGVHAGVLLHPLDGEGELPVAVEDLEHLLVADGVEGVLVAVGQHPAGFLKEAIGHHLVHAPVDAVEEVGALTAQAELDDAEGALLVRLGAEAGERLPRLVADLQGRA